MTGRFMLGKRGWCGMACAALLMAAGPARGQSFGVDLRNTLMPASGGMAGTSVAAPQDFLSAINANPAALTQYEGTHFTIGGGFVEATANLTQTAPVRLLGVEPFSAKSSTPGAIVPAIGVAQELDQFPLPTTVGLALVGAAGAGTSYVGQPASNGTSSYLLVLEFAPSVAVALTDRLSLGGTLFIGDAYASGPFVGRSTMTNAYALRGGVGLDYRLGDATWLGAYYQSTQTFRFQDQVVLFQQAGPRDVDIGLPQQVGVGIANSSLLDGRLLLAADALYLDWDSAALFQSLYQGQWVMQLGAQYRVSDRLTTRVGYGLAGNPIDHTVGTRIGPVDVPGGIPAVKYLQSQYAVVNQHRFTAGLGFADVLPGIDFDGFAGGMFPESEQLGATTFTSLASWWIGLGFTWHYDRARGR
jgi:long-chain fatty acid transport protein